MFTLVLLIQQFYNLNPQNPSIVILYMDNITSDLPHPQHTKFCRYLIYKAYKKYKNLM
jgi:hypothetical protein